MRFTLRRFGKTIFVIRHSFYGLAGAIVAVVVHHDEVEGEVGLLLQHAADGILDSADTVANGNHHRSLHGEVLVLELDFIELIRCQ